MPIDPSTAFFSYSREDMEFAVRLAKDLKAKGAKVWMDKIDIRPGQRWEAEIETAVDSCSRMLVVLSPAAITSSNVLAEASLALDEGKSVIPVLYRDCRVPFRLRPFQYADFRSDYSVGLEELLATLGGGGRAVSGPEAIALAAISEALGLDPAPPIVSSSAAAEERERQQKALKPEEQAETERLAALAEAERKQREQAEAARLALVAEAELKATEEKTRQAEFERRLLAAEQERQRPNHQNAQISAPAPDIISLKYSSWAKGGIALLALLVVGWLVYWASSRSHRAEPAAKTETAASEPNTQTSSIESETPPSGAEAKAAPPKPGPSTILATPHFTDPKTAELYRKAEAGDSVAMVDLGNAYDEGNGVGLDYRQAAYWYQKAADAGNAGGAYDLGLAYEEGRGVKHDYGEAFNWYRKAAEAGSGPGMANLGFLYLNGFGVKRDYKQAVFWSRKAAEAGNTIAMGNLGACYENGWGVAKDLQQAIAWYRKAAQLGDKNAKGALERLGENP